MSSHIVCIRRIEIHHHLEHRLCTCRLLSLLVSRAATLSVKYECVVILSSLSHGAKEHVAALVEARTAEPSALSALQVLCASVMQVDTLPTLPSDQSARAHPSFADTDGHCTDGAAAQTHMDDAGGCMFTTDDTAGDSTGAVIVDGHSLETTVAKQQQPQVPLDLRIKFLERCLVCLRSILHVGCADLLQIRVFYDVSNFSSSFVEN